MFLNKYFHYICDGKPVIYHTRMEIGGQRQKFRVCGTYTRRCSSRTHRASALFAYIHSSVVIYDRLS